VYPQFFSPHQGGNLIGPSPIFLEHGALPQHRSVNMLLSQHVLSCFPLSPHNVPQSSYTWKLNHGGTIWDKKWGAIGNILGNTLGTWGTFWEPDGNTLGVDQRIFKKKNLTPPWDFSLAAWDFYFQNGLSAFST
jgi:hypothetical protein